MQPLLDGSPESCAAEVYGRMVFAIEVPVVPKGNWEDTFYPHSSVSWCIKGEIFAIDSERR